MRKNIFIFLSLLSILSACDLLHRFRIKPDPTLTISDHNSATYVGKNVQYRIEASGLNSCCGISVSAQNLQEKAIELQPLQAKLSSKCNKNLPIDRVYYSQASGVKSFEEFQSVKHESHEIRPDVFPSVKEENPQKVILNSKEFLELSYGFKYDFKEACAPYRFTFADLGIDVTFTDLAQ